MGEHFIDAGVTVLGVLATVAIVAIIFSRKANTAGVIQAAASGYGNNLAVAISPITGAVPQPNLSYPGAAGGFTPSYSPMFG